MLITFLKMTFPDTAKEFMEQYKIIDTDGTELVPVFRMKQWFEHEKLISEKNEAELRKLKEELEYYKRRNKLYEMEVCNAKLNGMIEGLKYSIRCNGISGGEVKEESE